MPEERSSVRNIQIIRATENNLKDFSVNIPTKKLVVVAGPSGSGKSTLAHKVLGRFFRRKFGRLICEKKSLIPNYSPEVEIKSLDGADCRKYDHQHYRCAAAAKGVELRLSVVSQLHRDRKVVKKKVVINLY